MSGHSHWATIKHKKLAQDARKGKLFSKLARQLMVLARNGDDPTFNPALARAIREAKQAGMPKDRIEEAVKKGAGKIEGVQFEDRLYEAKAAGGAMLLIETLTDNSNRTGMEVRKLVERHNGGMVPPGAASNLFERKGYIYVEAAGVSEDEIMETAIDAGAENLAREGDTWEVVTTFEAFPRVLEALEKKFKVRNSEVPMVPKYGNYLTLSEQDARQLLKLIEVLLDHDDVQNVHHNANIPESVTAG